MHLTEPVYRNPYWPTFPLLQITAGCTHNSCKFCTMYKDVPFRMQPMTLIEEDLQELARIAPEAETVQLLSGNPLALSYDRLVPIFEKIHEYLPRMQTIYMTGRVTDLRNKTVPQLERLRDLGMNEVSLGVESGDDWTLRRINKGYTANDILEQTAKLDAAGIPYWMTYLNGVAGRAHAHDHAVNSARIFSASHPMVVGTGGLTLFPGTPLLEEAQRGEFDPQTEKELLIELRDFVANLETDSYFITHHTSGAQLTGPDFLGRKTQIIRVLDELISRGDMDRLAAERSSAVRRAAGPVWEPDNREAVSPGRPARILKPGGHALSRPGYQTCRYCRPGDSRAACAASSRSATE